MGEQKKVKAVWWNAPSKTREFTEQGFNYATKPRGWILAEDQSGVGVEKKTNPAVNHAALANHNAGELEKARANYKEATGQEAPKEWGEPKLFIETQKALKLKASQPKDETFEVDTPGGSISEPDEPTKPEPKKRGPKPKQAVEA